MEKRKKFTIILILGLIVLAIPVLLLGGFWLYRVKDSYSNITTGNYYGGVGFDNYATSERESLITPQIDMVKEGDAVESSSEDVDKSVIRTGSMSVAVDNIDNTLEEVTNIRNEYSADVVSLNDYGKGKERGVVLTIKVEESKFDELYNKLKDLDGEYEGSTITEQDVTDTVIDLKARLKNYRSVEAQLLGILETATSVEDILAVHKELTDIRYNIERIDAELKNISNQTEYSYIYLTISQSSTGAEVLEDEWKPVGVLRDAVRALVEFAKFIGSMLIWVLVFSPVVALIVGIVWFVKRKAKK